MLSGRACAAFLFMEQSPSPLPETASTLIARAFNLFWERRYGDALAAADAAISLDPSVTRAYLLKAATLAQMGRPREAQACAEEAVRRDPGNGVAFSVLAYCLNRNGDRPRAIAHFEHAVALSPDDFRVYYNYACFWAELRRPTDCARWLEAALRVDPDVAKTLLSDPDLARYAQDEWLLDLVAEFRTRPPS